MISVVYKKYRLKINAVWFCSDDINKVLKRSKADLVFFHGISENTFKNAVVNLQHTLITDLIFTAEDIFKQIHKNFRYEINRAKKENVKCIVFKTDEIKKDPSILSRFKQEYNDFTKLKGIQNAYNDCAMEQYVENDNVVLSKAFKGNEDYAQHIYVCDGKNARLLYSVSNFRIEGLDRNLIGRANKYLHWNDIQYLQNLNYQILDWGGVSSLTNPNGVDTFKIGFGGHPKKYYNIIIGKSLIGKLAVMAFKVKRG